MVCLLFYHYILFLPFIDICFILSVTVYFQTVLQGRVMFQSGGTIHGMSYFITFFNSFSLMSIEFNVNTCNLDYLNRHRVKDM